MKKKLFFIGSLMATSLVAANTLTVISCRKKISSVEENKDDEKNSEQVKLEKIAKFKNEIRNIMDDIITNPMNNLSMEWIINLNAETLNNYKEVIDFLNKTVEKIKNKDGKDAQVALSTLSELGSTLISKIKEKFVDLKAIILEQIKQMGDELGISSYDFNFGIDLESIEPMLTTMSGAQVMHAVNKLNKKPTWYSLNTKYDSKEEIDKIEIELFKVKTNVSYNINFGDINEHDSYNDAELLLTSNANDFKKINHYTQETVNDILTKSEELKNITLYSNIESEVNEFKKYNYVGKQMDWDFSKQVVKDEIKTIQYDKLSKELIKDKSDSEIKTVLEEMEFDTNNIEFSIDPFKYMKFDNYDMVLDAPSEDCILICYNAVPSRERFFVAKSNDAIAKINEQFFSDHLSDKTKWTGGKINHSFIKQVKKDGATVDENGNAIKPRIDLSKYYGLNNDYDDSRLKDMLIGYGTTTIKKANYAGIVLAKIIIDTNLISSPYVASMSYLYDDLRKYVKTFISAIGNEKATNEEEKNRGLRAPVDNGEIYYLRWIFSNKNEWDIIEKEIKKTGELSFEWIMEDVLYKKRILGNSEYKSMLPLGYENIAKTSLKSRNGIKYVQYKIKDNLLPNPIVARDYADISARVFIKYGPFVVYLNGDDSRAIWSKEDNSTGIASRWYCVDDIDDDEHFFGAECLR